MFVIVRCNKTIVRVLFFYCIDMIYKITLDSMLFNISRNLNYFNSEIIVCFSKMDHVMPEMSKNVILAEEAHDLGNYRPRVVRKQIIESL